MKNFSIFIVASFLFFLLINTNLYACDDVPDVPDVPDVSMEIPVLNHHADVGSNNSHYITGAVVDNTVITQMGTELNTWANVPQNEIPMIEGLLQTQINSWQGYEKQIDLPTGGGIIYQNGSEAGCTGLQINPINPQQLIEAGTSLSSLANQSVGIHDGINDGWKTIQAISVQDIKVDFTINNLPPNDSANFNYTGQLEQHYERIVDIPDMVAWQGAHQNTTLQMRHE
ncbi:hypothetical protein KAI92_03155 [Candidatus Parcubacteria bacterium]|nr:hypothetical protein [Candidatus Parcubacteria bacterium]